MNETIKERRFKPLDAIDGLSNAEILMAMNRVLAVSEFQANPSASAFLRFVVEETLAGRGDRLKAFAIATLALRQPDSFNPQINSLVRVQATRLRAMLDHYYVRPGADDPIRISLPRGAYQLHLERATYAPREAPAGPVGSKEVAATDQKWSRRRATLLSLAMAVAVLLGTVILYVYSAPSGRPRPPRPGFTSPPSIAVSWSSSTGQEAEGARFAFTLVNALEQGLGGFDYVRIRQPTVPSPFNADYELHFAASKTSGGLYDIFFSLTDQMTGETIWTLERDGIGGADQAKIKGLASAVVELVADISGGAIFSDLMSRQLLFNLRGNAYTCELASAIYVRDHRQNLQEESKSCLEDFVVQDPENFGILAALATRLIVDYLNVAPNSRGAADLQRAMKIATHAYILAPQRVSSQTALFMAQFYNRRFEDAHATALKAIATNPDDTEFMARIARGYISQGLFKEGLALMEPIENRPFGPPASLLWIWVLAAHMRDDDVSAYRYAMRGNIEASALGLTMRVIACNRSGDQGCVNQAKSQLRVDFPDFSRDLTSSLDRYAFTDGITAQLLKDLSEAGFSVASPRH